MDLERDFAAWADRRDPDALGRVFDATAGRLSLLATHVTGGDAGAEDLVQSTFVAAMTQSGSWDRHRPLWPWLAGILQNQVRMHGRRRQRRREVGLDAVHDAPADRADPAAHVASDEAFAALVAAIDALPLSYRQVLRLRLVHGLEPIEIARALERPVGTVRAQLHRGRAQLRGALPAGFAIAAAALLGTEGALLAQVRAQAIARAHEMAAGTTATSGALMAAGWWTMSGKTLTGIVATVLLLLLWISREDGPPGAGHLEPAPRPSTPARSEVVERDRAPDDASTVPDRVAITRETPVAWPLHVRLVGPAAAVAGVPVRVWVEPCGSGFGEPARAGREDVASGTTDAGGAFRCALDAYRDRSPLLRRTSFVVVEIAPAGYRAQRDLLGLPRTTEPQAFSARFELETGVRMVGHAVDETGAPVAGARIDGVRAELPDAPHHGGVTAADGSFCIEVDAGEPELWPARLIASAPAVGRGVLAVPRPPVPPTAGSTFDAGTVVLTRGGEIRGRVVLGDGSPLADYPLLVATITRAEAADAAALAMVFRGARNDRAARSTATVTTAADGSFVRAGLEPDAICAIAVRDASIRMTTAVAHAGEPVRLVVDRQLLRLDVRDADGEPLPGLTVRGAGYDPELDTPSWERRPGFPTRGQVGSGAFFPLDPAGRRLVLSPFTWTWCLYVTDETAQATPLRHDAMPGVHRLERSLVVDTAAGFGALHLVVVDADGRRVDDYGFRMRHVDRDLSQNHARLIPPEDQTYRELAAGRWRLTMLLGHPLPEVFGLDTPGRGAQDFDVVIEDGETAELRVVSAPAGRVAFRLRADRPPASGHWGNVQIVADADGATIPTTMEYDDPTRTDRGLGEVFFLCTPAFAPGLHGFVVKVDGYLPAPCQVDVVDDRLTPHTIELLPR